MAKKKSENTAAINFRCTPTMKRSVEILTVVHRAENVSKFLESVMSQVIELNRDVIDTVNAAKFVSPFDTCNSELTKAEKTTSKNSSLKKDAAPLDTNTETKGDDSNGED